ncbi:electron transport complex protein RnfG [Formivibrio citricus]|uniref:Ion-translocating oxidoreductase complex subunit G n=1 Tax=Formivibrio citricus TaxID=83765 RepID=A0A1I5AG07_9NEIS|nr:electron transport complex subunit RsxG [Formivibrio citricus]SFN61411.1 electron transport complex protein RnfG [Formivibrio citricus]
MKAMISNGVRGAGILAAFTVVFTALMAGAYSLTREIVLKNEEQARTQLIAQTLPAGSYDNNLLADTRLLSAEDSRRLGNDKPASIYLAKKGGKTVAAVLEAVAPDGYAGKIQLLVAVAANGNVLGVRVVTQQETPGLGDYIDAAKSNWIRQFEGKSLASPEVERWKVRKDGGVFDSNAGATISPRAVVGAVKRTLEYVVVNRTTIFE